MPAAWAGVAVAAGSAIAGQVGKSSASSAISGASAQAQALDEQARQTGQANYNAAISNVQPYISTGQNALTQYGNLLGVNGQDAASSAMSTFQASPGYQYQLQQGLKAVDAGAASQGMLRSGATLRAEQTLGSSLANNDFSSYLGRLNSLAGLGLQGAQAYNTATGTFDNLLTQTTNDQTGTITSAAKNQAGLDIYGATNLSNAAGSAISTAQKNGLFDSAYPSGYNYQPADAGAMGW